VVGLPVLPHGFGTRWQTSTSCQPLNTCITLLPDGLNGCRIVVEETHGNRRQLVLRLVPRSELPASEQMH
jgi:hypothetical protein